MTLSQSIKLRAYVLDAINNEDYTLSGAVDKLTYFAEKFSAEYWHARGALVERVADYLRGLPSCCSVAFQYCDIIAFGQGVGLCGSSNAEISDFCDSWWGLLAGDIVDACNFYKITIK